MKIAYPTIYDSTDERAWSGLGFNIARCLELAGFNVRRIGPLRRRRLPLARLWQVEARLYGRHYALDRDLHVARAYASQVAKSIESQAYDLVFSPGTVPVAYLQTRLPIVIWTDAPFAAMLRSYPEFQVYSRRSIRSASDLEAHALQRASLAFFASTWGARSAVEDHGADPQRVGVLPFGANMRITHGREEIVTLVRRRPAEMCRLLFVGVHWHRKRGDRAVEAARILNERGLPTELHVVGPGPDQRHNLPSWVRVYGYVDKRTEAGASLMRRLYENSHFLIHPASAEAFGVVFCEAAAHGVVSIASNVGGIPSAVRDGITGILCDPVAPGEEYADEVWRLMQDRTMYEAMAVGAFDEYRRNLSWEAQAVRVKARLAEVA